MTEFYNHIENSIEARIANASEDLYLVAAATDLYFGDSRRDPRYDADEVIEVIMNGYNLSDQEARRAMDLCEDVMIRETDGMPSEEKSKRKVFRQIVKDSCLDTDLAILDPRIERIAGIIAYEEIYDKDEINNILDEVGRQYGLNKQQVSKVLNSAVAKYKDEVDDARRAGEL